MADRFTERGYHTGLIGKGHLTTHQSEGTPDSYTAMDRAGLRDGTGRTTASRKSGSPPASSTARPAYGLDWTATEIDLQHPAAPSTTHAVQSPA